MRYLALKSYGQPQDALNNEDALNNALMRSLYMATRFKELDKSIAENLQSSYMYIVMMLTYNENFQRKTEVFGRLQTLHKFFEVVYQNSQQLFTTTEKVQKLHYHADKKKRFFALCHLEKFLKKEDWPEFLLNTNTQRYWEEEALVSTLAQSAFAPALSLSKTNESLINLLCLHQEQSGENKHAELFLMGADIHAALVLMQLGLESEHLMECLQGYGVLLAIYHSRGWDHSQLHQLIPSFTQWHKLSLVIEHYLNKLEAKGAYVTVSEKALTYFVEQLEAAGAL